ncbi:MAG: DCC1-like thiol-disulfide oxidoreductase family protein [Bacteroidota bacterium]
MIEQPVILFDGVCNYCNSMVKFAIRNDKKSKLKFAPLQSITGEALRARHKIPAEIDSVILIENEEVFTYSDAALRICKWLDWPAKLLYAFIIVPKFIRQPFYKWVAKNRYKWFGKKETCMVPTQDVKHRFLD